MTKTSTANWPGRVGTAGVALLAILTIVALEVRARESQTPAASAAKANPELVGALTKELGATPEQAAGAAGALFGVAKSRLSADEFSQVAQAVPGIDALLAAAPSTSEGAGPAGIGGLSKSVGTAGSLASAASAFSKLGLKPDLVGKAVPVLTSFVTKSGGANVGQLLAGALK